MISATLENSREREGGGAVANGPKMRDPISIDRKGPGFAVGVGE